MRIGKPGTAGRGAGATSQTSAGDDERQLLASLRELTDHVGPVKAGEALGVTYRTVTRAIETKTLTRRMEDALKLRRFEAGGTEAEPVMRRLDALERRQDELEAGLLMLAQEMGAWLAKLSGDSGELRGALPARDSGGEPEKAGGAEAGRDVSNRLPLGHPRS